MMRYALVVGCTLAATDIATADFSHVEVRDVSAEVGAPAGLVTWRFFAVFTEPFNLLLAAGSDPGTGVAVRFETNDPAGIINEGGSFSGQKAEDFANAPVTAAWDSWLTIQDTRFVGNDTDYSPGFLNNDGINAVLLDGMTSFIEAGDDGWFDSEPGTPKIGPDIPIAQFTVRAGFGVRLSGNVFFCPGTGFCSPSLVAPFCASTFGAGGGPCPADLDEDAQVAFSDLLLVLASWGRCPGDDCCGEDLDGSGRVDFPDLLRVLSTWGPCPSG